MKKYEIFVFLNEYDENGELVDCIKETSLVEYDDYDKAEKLFEKIKDLA